MFHPHFTLHFRSHIHKAYKFGWSIILLSLILLSFFAIKHNVFGAVIGSCVPQTYPQCGACGSASNMISIVTRTCNGSQASYSCSGTTVKPGQCGVPSSSSSSTSTNTSSNTSTPSCTPGRTYTECTNSGSYCRGGGIGTGWTVQVTQMNNCPNQPYKCSNTGLPCGGATSGSATNSQNNASCPTRSYSECTNGNSYCAGTFGTNVNVGVTVDCHGKYTCGPLINKGLCAGNPNSKPLPVTGANTSAPGPGGTTVTQYDCVYSQGPNQCFTGVTTTQGVTFNNGCHYIQGYGQPTACPGGSNSITHKGCINNQCVGGLPGNGPDACQTDAQCVFTGIPTNPSIGTNVSAPVYTCDQLGKNHFSPPYQGNSYCASNQVCNYGETGSKPPCLTVNLPNVGPNGGAPIPPFLPPFLSVISRLSFLPVLHAETFLASNVLAANVIMVTDTAYYNPSDGTFSNPNFKLQNLPAGQYQVLLHVNGYLDKLLAYPNGNVFSITPGQNTFSFGPVVLTPGDVVPPPNGDNMIDIQDYNAVASCLGLKSTSQPTATCPNPSVADLNKDGKIDQQDLDSVKANFGQHGDIFTVSPTIPGSTNGTSPIPTPTKIPTYTCVTDPSCATSNQSLQVCPLKCTLQ